MHAPEHPPKLLDRVRELIRTEEAYVHWIRRPSCLPRSARFANDVDYAMLSKVYGRPLDGENRYSRPECIGCETKVVSGDPDPEHVSTSFVERANLTMRMGMRCFTRLTNAFSKKIENHTHSVALHFMHYNFARVHQTLRVTPATGAGVADHVWTIEEIVDLVPVERQVILK